MLDFDLQDDLLTRLEDRLGQAALALDAAPAAAHALFLIQERTAAGEFLPGSSPGAERYSENPFARPAGGLPKRIRDVLDDTPDGASFFTRAGALWVVVERGYRWLREAMGLPTDRVTLDVTGDMLRALRGRATATDGGLAIEVGYIDGMSDADAARIADFHQNKGAGKSRIVRKFIGLLPDEIIQVVAKLAEALRRDITE